MLDLISAASLPFLRFQQTIRAIEAAIRTRTPIAPPTAAPMFDLDAGGNEGLDEV